MPASSKSLNATAASEVAPNTGTTSSVGAGQKAPTTAAPATPAGSAPHPPGNQSTPATTVACAGGETSTRNVDVSAWNQIGLHPRLLAEVQRAAAKIAVTSRPSTSVVADAAVSGSAEESTASTTRNSETAVQQDLSLCLTLVPSALVTRVLARTTSDFADVVVDARCACGVDSQRQSAAKKSTTPSSITSTTAPATSNSGSHNNNGSSSGSAASTVPYHSSVGTTASIWMDRTAAAAAGTEGTSDAPSEKSVWQRDPTGIGRAVFNRAGAVAERRLVAVLYALHALLTASTGAQSSNHSRSSSSAETSAAAAAPEATGVLVAATPESAKLFVTLFTPLANACGVELLFVEEGEQPPTVERTSSSSSSAPLSSSSAPPPFAARLYLTTMPGLLQWEYAAFVHGNRTTKNSPTTDSKNPTKHGAGDKPRRFLVVLAVEDLAYSLSHTNERLKAPDSALAASVATVAGAAEGSSSGAGGGFSALVRTNAAGPWPAAEKAWDAVLAQVQLYADQRATAAVSGASHGSNAGGAPLRFPFFFWLTLGPISSLSPLARSRLSRRNRRYYPLTTSTYLSAAEAAITASGPGTTAPLSSTRMVYLFSTDDMDKEAQLQMILKQTHLFKRVLLLTHHKEVRQLYALIQRWGIYAPSSTGASQGEESTLASHAEGAKGTAGRQFFVLRTDLPERSTNVLLDFSSPTPAASYSQPATAAAEDSASSADDAARRSGEASLLVGWDSFTAVDVMDVDCVIQYFPPQKSLTDREWTEFIQNLHTTADAEADIEFSLYSNLNNTEKNIFMKVRQLQEELGPCGSAKNRYHSAARRHPIPTVELEPTTVGAPITANGTARCGIRPPTIITMMGPPDLSLTAFFMQQYYYSGARGSLSTAAANASLAAAVRTGGGATGLPESVVASHAFAHVPVLNIASTHPWFVPLVCGGPPLSPATNPRQAAQLKMGTDGKPLNITTVLKKKIALERCEQMRAGREPSASPVPYVIPCLFPKHSTPHGDERAGAESGGCPTAPTSTAMASSSTSAGAAQTAGKGGGASASVGSTPMPRGAANNATGGGNSAGANNSHSNRGTNKSATGKDRASPATASSQPEGSKKKGQQQTQQKDMNNASAGGKGKQEDARGQTHTDTGNSGNGGGHRGNHKKSRSRKKGGHDGAGGESTT